MRRQKYKKHKDLIRDAVAHALERSSDRAKEVLREQADLRLLKDIIKAEQELGDY